MRDAVVAPIQTLPEHLRQSSGTDLSVHTREHLDKVAIELNGRPRKTFG